MFCAESSTEVTTVGTGVHRCAAFPDKNIFSLSRQPQDCVLVVLLELERGVPFCGRFIHMVVPCEAFLGDLSFCTAKICSSQIAVLCF